MPIGERPPLDGLAPLDGSSPPFDRFKRVQPLATARSGRDSFEHARHHLYVGRDKRERADALIKLTAKPGLIYQRDLSNEIATLSTVNRELPGSPYFPIVWDSGRQSDGRVYLITSFFDEFPLATAIAAERIPAKMVAHLRTAIEVAKALVQLHRLGIFHVDLNPMNILHREEQGRPIVRIVDFESSYEVGRYSTGAFYCPPTTPEFSAPEVSHKPPDARSDVYSLGAVLYTLLVGYQWTWKAELARSIAADPEIDPALKEILFTAVAPAPDRRYPSAQDLHDVLAAYLEGIWPGRSW